MPFLQKVFAYLLSTFGGVLWAKFLQAFREWRTRKAKEEEIQKANQAVREQTQAAETPKEREDAAKATFDRWN